MSLPEHLRQLALTGSQSKQEELVQALTDAADEIEILWQLVDCHRQQTELLTLVNARFMSRWENNEFQS